MKITRRELTAGLAGSVLAPSRVLGANDRIRAAFVGISNRGSQLMEAALPNQDLEVVAICDVWDTALDKWTARLGAGAKRYTDYRQILDRKDVDVVVIATPDHWHALQMIQACNAGKDAYVEKPLSLCVFEGRKMVEAARKYNRVTQVGIHRRSSPFVREAADIVRSGYIGKVMAVRAFHIQNEWPNGIGNPPDEA